LDEYRWVVDQVRAGIEMPDDDVSTIHPSLVRTSTGDLLLYGNTYAGNRHKAKSYGIVVARSRDNGETWSPPEEIPAEHFAGEKGVCVNCGATLKSGRIVFRGFFGTTEAQPTQATTHPTGQVSPYGFPVLEMRGRSASVGKWRALLSDDDGQTWRMGEPIDTLGGGMAGGFTQIPDGTLILPVVGYRHGAGETEQSSNAFVRSQDEGETWSKPTIVAPWDERLHDMPSEMGIVVLPDGRWVALYRDQFRREDHGSTGLFVYRSYSHDGGRTWTVGHQMFPNMGYTTARLLPDGALMVIGHSHQGLLYAVSNSGGETWDYQNLLWGRDPRAGGDCGGFSIVDLADGRILVAYYARADRSTRLETAFRYGKMRLEVAWLEKVRADSAEGRMR